MNLRRKLLAFLQSQKKDVEYTELEYLESTGTYWIDTGITYQPIKAVINLCFTESATRELMGFGPYGSAYIDKTSDGLLGLGGGTTIQNSNAYKWQEIVYKTNGGTPTAIAELTNLDGSVTRTSQMGGTPGTFYLFGVYGNTSYNCRVKISSAKIYNANDELIADLIPVLDKDLVPCMYDKITGKYLYNQGDGEFKWKLPNQLEYLESDGNQWIDTGFIGNQDTETQGRFLITQSSQRVYGSYATDKNITAYESTSWGNHRFGNQTALIVAPLNEPITIIQNKDGVTYNGTLYSYTNVNDFETNSTLYVGDINGFVGGNRLIGNWYYFKILQNGKIVMYLIPAFDENLTPCMYDLVSKQYFRNQGTGSFKGYFEDGSRLVSYLSATGTQWIDTGITPLIGDEIELKNVQCERKVSGYQAVFSAGTGDYQTILLVGDGATYRTAFYKYFATGGAQNVDEPFNLNNLTKIKVDGEGSIYYNDEFVIQSPPVQETDSSLRLFYRANNSSPMTGNIGAVSIKRDGNFVVNLVPVVKSDNTVCMLDLVSKQYFVNQGSGSFSYGTESS